MEWKSCKDIKKMKKTLADYYSEVVKLACVEPLLSNRVLNKVYDHIGTVMGGDNEDYGKAYRGIFQRMINIPAYNQALTADHFKKFLELLISIVFRVRTTTTILFTPPHCAPPQSCLIILLVSFSLSRIPPTITPSC
jgi:hypothetical protein